MFTRPQVPHPCLIYVSIRMSADQTLSSPSVIPNVCIEISQKSLDSLALTLCKTANFFHEISGYSALALGTYACELSNNINLNMHLLSPRGRYPFNTTCQLRAYEHPAPACANFVTETFWSHFGH